MTHYGLLTDLAKLWFLLLLCSSTPNSQMHTSLKYDETLNDFIHSATLVDPGLSTATFVFNLELLSQ